MHKIKFLTFFNILILIIIGISFTVLKPNEDSFINYQVNLKKIDFKMYWKNEKNENFKSIQNLKSWLETKNKKLDFATNGGMYMKDHSPVGLFIQDQKTITPLNIDTGTGNFYWKPNGVLFIDKKNNATICITENFIDTGQIKYATQSGPMLVIDGKIHPEFRDTSKYVNIRNGVGLLPNNNLVFSMSKKEINLYEFAKHFKELGCKNALYLDGFVSRTYLPAQNWIQTDGDFGVIVGVTSKR